MPRRSGTEDDDDAALAGYELALAGVDYQALGETIGAIIRGEVDGMSTRFCPTPPELSKAVRDRMRRDRVADDKPALGYQPLPFRSIEMRIDAARAQMAREGRKFICSVDTWASAREMIKRGVVPPGSIYSGLLGEFYSPINYQPEGTDHDRQQPVHDATPGYVSERDGPGGRDEIAGQEDSGPDEISEQPDDGDDWRRFFATEQSSGLDPDAGEAPGTLDGDRGSTGLATAAE